MVILLIRTVKGDSPELLYSFYPWAENLIFLNSSLNPMIYCWRNREIRHVVFRFLSPLTSKLFKNRKGSLMNMADGQNEKSKTPKTEYATFAIRIGPQNSKETIKDVEVLSICSKD